MSISVLGGVPLPNSEASLGGGVGSLAMIALLLLLVVWIDEFHHFDFTRRYDRSFDPCNGNPLVPDEPFTQYDLEVTSFRAAGPLVGPSVKPSLPL